MVAESLTHPFKDHTRVAIIGGGVAGLSTAVNLLDEAQQKGLPLAVTVFEMDEIPGGNLRTLRRDDWQLEWGPNGFLDNEPATLRLVERASFNDEMSSTIDQTSCFKMSPSALGETVANWPR